MFCRDIFVYRLGNGASQASVPDPLEWYSGDTRKDGTFLQGLIKTMPYYGSSYNAPDDVTIGTLMNFSDTTYEGTSDGGYFLGAISGPTDKVDFINWFVPDFYVFVSEVFDDLNIQYRGKYVGGDVPAFSIKTSCGSGYNPSLIFLFPEGLENDWQQANITIDTPFAIYASGFLELDGTTTGSIGVTYNYTAWSTQSGGTIRGCFDNAGFAAFGSGFNIGNGNSATAFYLDWFKASYYYNGSRVNFDKAPV